MKRYTADFQESARLVVLNQGLNPTAAAEKLGVPVATLRAWRKRDLEAGKPWEPVAGVGNSPVKRDRATLVSTLLEDYLALHLEAMAALKQKDDDPLKRVEAISRLSQALDRTLRALNKASPELSRLTIAHEFLDRQGQFIKEHFPQHLPAFLEILDPFGMDLARHMSTSTLSY